MNKLFSTGTGAAFSTTPVLASPGRPRLAIPDPAARRRRRRCRTALHEKFPGGVIDVLETVRPEVNPAEPCLPKLRATPPLPVYQRYRTEQNRTARCGPVHHGIKMQTDATISLHVNSKKLVRKKNKVFDMNPRGLSNAEQLQGGGEL